MSRLFADRWPDDYKQGEKDFERNGKADYSKDKYSSRDENYFGGFEEAQEKEERREEERYQQEQYDAELERAYQQEQYDVESERARQQEEYDAGSERVYQQEQDAQEAEQQQPGLEQ